jgi:hypothetical protein
MASIPFEQVIGPLSAALGLSVGVERILEFFKNILEPRIGTEGVRGVPKLDVVENKAEELAAVLKSGEGANEKEWDERVHADTVLVQPATDPDDGETLRAFVIQLLGFAVGILLARIFNVQLFAALGAHLPFSDQLPLSPPLDFVLTGLLIAGGSGPIHVLIQFISERKIPAEVMSPAEEAAPAPTAGLPAAPAVITTPADPAAEEWVDIPYDGGVDRDVLENVHHRDKNPNLVVYHHTAMGLNRTFEDVVNVIKSRTDAKGNRWLTGYHCVVLADGSIHPFCGWDRAGTHAAGYNNASLGIAFNGNFETDPKVPYSNPTGRYGPPRPTDMQLKAGAKVVTLWSFLYPDIKIDFEKSIIPHKKVADKPCPGSQFPYEEFKKLVAFYRGRWEKSASIKERIEAFKLKPFLYKK